MKYVIRSTNPATQASTVLRYGPFDTKVEAETKRTDLAVEEQLGSSGRFPTPLVFTVEEFDHG